MFMTLIVVMGSCVYTYLQSYKVIHIKYIQLFERKKKKTPGPVLFISKFYKIFNE